MFRPLLITSALTLSTSMLSPIFSETTVVSPKTGNRIILAQKPIATQGKLYTFTSDAAGFDTHTFYYDTGKEVVVFDAQFTQESAQKAIEEIQAKTSSPIAYVVITHPNPDKFNGVAPFQKLGAKVVASEATAKAIPDVYAYKKYYFVNIAKKFTDANYPPKAKVDITFKNQYELPLKSGAKVVLQNLKHAGVSTTQTVAYIPTNKALIVGDLINHNAHGWLEGGIQNGKPHPDLAAWNQALDELLAFPQATVYGGRGESAPVAIAVRNQKAYLNRMTMIVTQYITRLGSRKSELSGPMASEHYKKIMALASESFPKYKFPYLVEYGVYGLVNSKLDSVTKRAKS
jgi:glyoxylase-like metal-dependent hydrolase (beta-lactamase superfamily II)